MYIDANKTVCNKTKRRYKDKNYSVNEKKTHTWTEEDIWRRHFELWENVKRPFHFIS